MQSEDAAEIQVIAKRKISLFRFRSFFLKWIGIVSFFLVWECISRFGIVNARFLPPFSQVIVALFKSIADGTIGINLATSLKRSLLGFIMAAVIFVPFGIFMGRYPKVERYSNLLVQICRNISVLALFPLFIILFGVGEKSIIIVVFWGAIWPILINTVTGVKNADPLFIKAAKSVGANQFIILFRVILPNALPEILTGLRISAARSVVILVAAEMLGAKNGLGYLIFYEQEMYQIPQMYAVILMFSIVGFLLNFSLVHLQKQLSKWKYNEE